MRPSRLTDDAGDLEALGAAGADARHRAQDLLDAVGRPRAGLGDHEGPVGGEQAVDREQAERRRAVDDHEVVVDALHGDLQPVLRADGVVGQLRLALGEQRRAGGHVGHAAGVDRSTPARRDDLARGRRAGRLSSAWSTVSSGSQTPRPVVALACGSRSTTSTRRPAWAAAEASPSATVVLPTPPFWLTSAIVDMAVPALVDAPPAATAGVRRAVSRIL